MRCFLYSLAFAVAVLSQGSAADFQITSFSREGRIAWVNAFPKGICTIEAAPAPVGPWKPVRNLFTTDSAGAASVPAAKDGQFFRLLAVDISGGVQGFQNLVASYGLLNTVAGRGDFAQDGMNNWRPEFEGGPAAQAELSRPHFAMADDAGNIYIADKDSHSILKVTPDGTIHTVAGTHAPGDNGDGPAPGTTLQLKFPNGEWVRGDGTVFILDTENGKVRRLGPDGVMTTLFTVSNGIKSGRGLWVRDDEQLAYFASGTDLRKWTPGGGVKTVNNNFTDLGNLVVDSSGAIIATDRGANAVYRVVSGNRTRIAGNGTTFGGGDGFPALETGLAGVRGVWLMPNGGYLLATHAGSQVWCVDPDGIIHLLVDGIAGSVHAGDDDWFYSPGLKISEVRSVTMDRDGNILITENDFGFIRRIRFQRLAQ
jgi:hypothetical protein